MSLPSKIFERIIFDSVKHCFYSNFDRNQFGFRPNSSTTCALIKLHNRITCLYDCLSIRGIQICTLDFTKAFDCLNHNVIIQKLFDCNFPLPFIRLMYSYLEGRLQCVRFKNFLSNALPVTSGVPQGSIIGPSLFSLVVSDLQCLYPDTQIVKYADDIILCLPVYNSINHVIEEIDNIRTWSKSVGLQLNDKKCNYMYISRSNDCVPVEIPSFNYCTNVKILGVTFSSDLKWDTHFKNVSRIAHRRAFALRTLKPFLCSKQLLIVYKANVLSILEYCSPLFVGINRKIDII